MIRKRLTRKVEYSRKGITLVCDDCRNALDHTVTDGVDCCITDPPYGIKLENHARGKERRDMDWTIHGDGDQLVGQLVADYCQEVKLPTLMFASPMKPWAGDWRQFLVWDKGEHVSGGGDLWTCWKPSWELIQVARNKNLNGKRDGAVLRYPAVTADYAHHPTPKPMSLMVYLVSKMTNIGDCGVFDPFMGSGTTGVACARLGRRFLGIEIDREHFETAKQRIDAELDKGRLPGLQSEPRTRGKRAGLVS